MQENLDFQLFSLISPSAKPAPKPSLSPLETLYTSKQYPEFLEKLQKSQLSQSEKLWGSLNAQILLDDHVAAHESLTTLHPLLVTLTQKSWWIHASLFLISSHHDLVDILLKELIVVQEGAPHLLKHLSVYLMATRVYAGKGIGLTHALLLIILLIIL